MNRKKLLEKAFQRGRLLTVRNKFYRDWIKRFIVDETKADIGTKGDITTNAVLKDGKRIKAVIYSRSNGIAAGIEEASLLLKDSKIKARQLKKDGAKIKKGSSLLLIEGHGKDILKMERPILDILSRMSGIATLTDSLIKKIKNKVPIASTRKIEWRYLDKKAVYIGGGLTHRLALWESILVKDTHLDAIKKEGVKDPVGISLERAWKKRKKGIFIEIEVNSKKMAVRAAEKFKELQKKADKTPCFIMMDNVKPNEIRKIISELKKKNLYRNILLEASGGINPGNIIKYAKSNVDVLSLGYLTHSVKALDIKQKILK